jgi:aspartyl-tRNA(Asn)/glutamyl-tRNA(Gln) amidotransferase subunit A
MTIKRVEAVNPILNAFATIYPEQALDQARTATEALSSGRELGPLAGLPIGVKDLEDVKGMVTSYGSVPYKENVAGEDSIQVARLKGAGAIVLGKTNTPEFGFTGFTKNRVFGVTRNPWNTEHTPGGSSGGSAAAVTSGMVSIATGSDGGGSTRIPASYSGCYGIKTSAGRIPFGPKPLLFMDRMVVMGPLTRTVEDAAMFLDCVVGYHPSDPDSLPHPALSYVECLDKLPSGLKIAFSPTLGYAHVQKDVMDRVQEAVKGFEEMGHIVETWEGQIPDPEAAWSILMNCDTYAQVHEGLEKNREDMGRTLVKVLDHAKSVTMADFIEAYKIRTELNRILWELFDHYDLLLTPTMPTEAFGAKGPPPAEIEGRPISLLGAIAFTYPFNLSGHPAASVPAGQTDNGLPAGLQIIGPRHRDDLVLQASRAYERVRPWKDSWPKIG